MGRASQKTIKEFYVDENSQRSFLEILRDEEVLVASSCFGEGVCKRCIINNDVLSCQLTPSQISESEFEILIDYL